MHPRFFLPALALALLSLTGSAHAASAVATYELNGNFNADEPGAPALAPTDPLNLSKFTADTVLGQSRTVWAFDGAGSPVTNQAGLTASTAGLISPHNYSVDFVMEFTERDSAWRRLIDVQNRQSDAGFYVNPANNLDVYPVGGATGAWTNNVYHHVVLTTDGTTVNAYLDGVSQFTAATNLLNLDLDPTDNPSGLMNFFLDNVAGGGQGEWSAGSVALIRLWDGVLTPAEAQALATNPFVAPPPAVTITSPPAGLSLVGSSTSSIAVEAPDASGLLSAVQFYLDNTLLGSVPAPGPYVLDFKVPKKGTHTIMAVGVDTDGRQSTATSTFVAVKPDPAHPAPTISILTDADGRTLAAGATFTLTSSAFSNTPGEELQEVDFYADGALFASFDGQGNPLTSLGVRPIRRDAVAAPSANGSVFSALFQMPGTSKLVGMISVALTKAGQAQVSHPVTVQAVANVADHPPVVQIGGAASGTKVPVSSTEINVPVTITDPDVTGTSSRTRAFDASGVIARVEYYLNQLKVKDSKEAPYGFSFAPSSPGTYVITTIATDGAGLATISDPVQIVAIAPPNVSVTVKGSAILSEGGKGKALFTRDGTDTSEDLTLLYRTKGSARNGVDYTELSGTVTIPAGAASAKVKIVPLDNGPATIKLQLLPSPAGIYNLGSATKAKFTLQPSE